MAKKRTEEESPSLYEKLTVDGFNPELSLNNRDTLSLAEKGTRYILKLSTVLPTAAFCVDGEIVRTGSRCDKLVLIDTCCESPNWVEVFVELKGSKISVAVNQLRETIKKPLFKHPSNRQRIYARIVGHSFPSNKSDNSLEKVKQEFLSRYSCDLKALKSGQPDTINVTRV